MAAQSQPLFSIHLANDASATSVVVAGDVDACTAPELRGVLGAVIALEEGPVMVDLSAVAFLGAAGARTLIDAELALVELGRSLDLVGVPAAARRLLDIVHGRLRG